MAHDPLGRLQSVTQGSAITRFGYDGSDLVTERDGSNTLTRRYVHGPGTDAPIVWYEGAGTTDRRFLHADERGSIVAVTSSTGGVLGTNRYNDYGVPSATNIGRFQYTGQTWMSELGLHNYKARFYDPKLGRFLQTDPIGYGDGMNMYAYVGGDPVNMVDPSGMTSCPPGQHWEDRPTSSKIAQCVNDGGGVASGFSPSSRLALGGGGGGLSDGYYSCVNCGQPGKEDSTGAIVVTAPVFSWIWNINSYSSFQTRTTVLCRTQKFCSGDSTEAEISMSEWFYEQGKNGTKKLWNDLDTYVRNCFKGSIDGEDYAKGAAKSVVKSTGGGAVRGGLTGGPAGALQGGARGALSGLVSGLVVTPVKLMCITGNN